MVGHQFFVMEKELIIYLITINFIGIILTCYDKIASKKFRRNRIRENVLLFVGMLGSAFTMYITMKIIHHKTKHKKFMITLPLMILAHIVIFYLAKGV